MVAFVVECCQVVLRDVAEKCISPAAAGSDLSFVKKTGQVRQLFGELGI